MKQWYEELFENYANKYDQETFPQGTLGECDFIEKEINCNRDVRILDIGCGTGRHSVELAKRGYSVTGIDLSESLLSRAGEKAAQQNVKVDFQRQDARNFNFIGKFELVINTFDLMTFKDSSVYETEEDDGKKLSLRCNERYYVPSEITWLLKTLGFQIIDIFGAKLGAFSRGHRLTTEDYEMLVVAQK